MNSSFRKAFGGNIFWLSNNYCSMKHPKESFWKILDLSYNKLHCFPYVRNEYFNSELILNEALLVYMPYDNIHKYRVFRSYKAKNDSIMKRPIFYLADCWSRFSHQLRFILVFLLSCNRCFKRFSTFCHYLQ